jgi:hypothetical protein
MKHSTQLVAWLSHYYEEAKWMPWKRRRKWNDCNISRSIFGSTSHCIITTIITRRCYLGLKIVIIWKPQPAAIYYRMTTTSSYTYLYYIHTNMYSNIHTQKKRTIWSEVDPSFRRFKVSTCLAAFSSDQSKSMPPVLTDMMSHTKKGIDELFFYKTTLSLNQSQFSPIHLLLS